VADEVVVTATARERRKFDAAFAVSVVSERQIETLAPLNTVDLFARLPGFGAEPSGGEGGNNVNVRGLPSSNFQFVALLEDGLPVFQEQQEPFLNADELVRIDLMAERVEAARGGTSSIYASNAPGATVNVITKTAAPEPEGALRVSWGDFGLYRLDGQASRALSPDLQISLGGYYRIDDGLRPTGFTADRGGQLRLNVTRPFEGGQLTVYAKRLDDQSTFYLPIPLADPRNPSVSLASLIDPRDGTLASNDFRYAELRTLDGTADGTTVREDLADGINPRITIVGGRIDRQFAQGWAVSDRVRYVEGSVKFNALFSLFPPEDANAFLAGQLARARSGFGPGVQRLSYVLAKSRAPDGTRVPFEPATTQGLVVRGGWWSVESDIANFMNDLRVTKRFETSSAGSHELSAGVYFSDYRLDQHRFFNTMLLELRSQPRALDVLALDGGAARVGSVTEDGFLSYGDNGDPGGHVDGRLWAIYAADEWRLNDRITLDAGLRRQRTRQSGYAMLRTISNLGDPQTLADDAVGGPSGILDRRSERFDATAWTTGVNFNFATELGAFARYTASFRMPSLSSIYTGASQVAAIVTRVKQGEIGLKWRSERAALFATAFWNRFDPLLESVTFVDAGGTFVSTPFVAQTESYGVELEGSARAGAVFEILGNLTLQRPRLQNLEVLGTGAPIAGVEGNQIRRLARVLGSLTPILNMTVLGHPGQLYATIYHQGRRFVDNANLTQLPSFTTLDAGLIYDPNAHLRVQFVGSNLTNEVGLTEGNPRVDTLAGQGTSTAIYARPIFGRTYRMSVTYRW
jgi:outer membrane receptor protein involved in Fe transport